MIKHFIAFFKQRHTVRFYVSGISQILLLIQAVMLLTGHSAALVETVQHNLLIAADTLFTLASTFGIAIDPTIKKFIQDIAEDVSEVPAPRKATDAVSELVHDVVGDVQAVIAQPEANPAAPNPPTVAAPPEGVQIPVNQ